MKKTILWILLSILFLSIGIQPVRAIAGLETIHLTPTGDSQIDYENINQNYGRLPYFSTRAYYVSTGIGLGLQVNTTENIKAVIKFDLSYIPRGSVIQNAYLRLYAYHVNTDSPCELNLSRIMSNWDERSITKNNSPQATSMNQYHYTVRGKGFIRSTNLVEAWQISDLVKKWYSGEYRNYGIMIDNRSGKEDSLCKFYSKDETVLTNQGKKPQLIIDYLPPLVISNATAPDNQITSTVAKIYWASNIPIISVIYYKKGLTGNWVAKMNNNLLTNDIIILTGLTPNTRYYYKFYARDDLNRDITTSESSFTTKKIPSMTIDLSRSLATVGERLISPQANQASGSATGSSGSSGTGGTTGSGSAGGINTNQQNQNNDIKIINLRYEMTDNGGSFWWTTKVEDGSEIMADVKTSGFVYLSKNNEPTRDVHDFDFGKNQAEVNHTVTLKYLEPATAYHYLVYSEDDAGNTGIIRGTITTKSTTDGNSGSTSDQTTVGSDGGNQTDANNNNSTAFPWGNNQEKTSQNGSVSGSQSPLRALLNKLSGIGSNNQTNKPNWFLIVLLLLIVVLAVLIMSKKKKNVTSNNESHDVKNPPVKEVPPKKGRGCLIPVLLIIGFFVLLTVGSMANMFLSPGMIPMLLEAAREKIGQSFSGIKNQSTNKNYKEAETSSSFAKIGGNTNLSFTAVDQSQWPKGAVGGLYKIEPSGNFSKLTDVTIDIKDNTTKGFALGYYHPDTKKWEYIPTIRIFGNTYKALIAHASEIGGYAFGLSGALDYEPHFQNASERAEWESLKTDLERIASDQSLGRDTSVAETMAESKLDRIASIILDRCATSKTFENQMDYFFIWHIAQLINATKVDEKLGTNMNRCVNLQATRAESRYDYMIRDRQDLKTI